MKPLIKRVQCLAFACCAFAAAPASAVDPVTLLALRMLRDHLITQALEAGLAAPQKSDRAPSPAIRTYPGDLKTLVDEGFPHLDRAQRAAVHARLAEVMNDPQHANERDAILASFVEAANASRAAHEALSKLSPSEKRALAMRAAESLRGRSAEEREEMVNLLRSPAIPLPGDLRALMLSELAADAGRPLTR